MKIEDLTPEDMEKINEATSKLSAAMKAMKEESRKFHDRMKAIL